MNTYKNNNSDEVDLSTLLNRAFPMISSFNIGICLIGLYFILEFGSVQMLYPIINQVKIPKILALACLLYGIHQLVTGSISFQSSMTKSFLILCVFIIIYAFIDTQNHEIKSQLIKGFIGFAAYYLVAIVSVKRIDQFILLTDIWLGSIALSCFHGVMQGGRIWGSMWLKDENTISLLAAMAIPFAFFLFFQYRSKLKKSFYLMCIASYLVLNVVAQSRGGILALCLMCSFLFFWLIKNKRIINLLIIIISIVILSINYLPERFINEMETLQEGTEEGTAADRMYLWSFCWKMFYDHQLLGVGPLNYPYYFSSYEKGRVYPLGARRPPHTTPLQWLAEMGVLGTILLIWLLRSFYKNWIKILRRINLIKSDEHIKDLMFYSMINHSIGITVITFWFGSIFLSLMPYPFFWCLPYFSQIFFEVTEDNLNRLEE